MYRSQTVLMVMLDLKVVRLSMKDVLKYALIKYGVLSVVMVVEAGGGVIIQTGRQLIVM